MRVPVGREAECGDVDALLAGCAHGPAALSLVGAAGIGKTTLCAFAVAQAQAAGYEVWQARPAAAETALGWAALTDLLAGVAGAELAELPGPQRAAIEVATLREARSGEPPTEREIATALASLLSAVSARSPLLLVLDDVPWLDQPSLDALRFALRRTVGVRVALLCCRRTGDGRGGDLVDALPPGGQVAVVELGGLDATSLSRVIQDELGTTVSLPVVARIAEVSGGNPLVSVEVARSYLHAGGRSPSDIEVPDRLRPLHAARLASISDDARDALLAVACALRPSAPTLTELGLADGLVEAEAEGLVLVVGDRVEPAHPLLASAVLDLAGADGRRAMHGRLYGIATNAEARARHGALADPGRSPAVAVALDDAVESSVARGALADASEFARLALDRTAENDPGAEWPRRIRLAELLHSTGATNDAGALMARLADRCPPGPLKARGWLLLTELSYQTSSIERSVECARAALDEAGDDAVLRARALLSLATMSFGGEDGARFAAEANQVLTDGGVVDNTLLAWAMCEEVAARFHLGEGLDRPQLDRAQELERTGRDWRSTDQVATVRPALLKSADLPDEALAALLELRARAAEEGNDGIVPYVLGHQAATLLRMGRVREAAAVAAEYQAIAEATGQAGQRSQAQYTSALISAQLGDLETAERVAAEVLVFAEAESDTWKEMSASAILGFVELSRDRPQAARPWLARWYEISEAHQLSDPGISRFQGDHIEALLGCGELDQALARTVELEGRAARASRVSAAALAARCRGLVAASRGDLAGAIGSITDALALHDKCPVPFEQARTLFSLGVVQRRSKHKREAADALGRARSGFGALEASVWLRRTDAELRRVLPSAADATELTPTERRVCELAALGLTNRQVAERAFISPKTVEANLARAYRKLGISSRAELGARMASEGGSAPT